MSADQIPNTRAGSLLKGFAWASLIANISIIGTGGAVRLTGSGLGCPTWPTCTPGSLLPTAELSWHSAIEFGNRLMTGVLGIIALVVLLLTLRVMRERKDLRTLAWTVIIGIFAQAIVGGITVWTGLNPVIVGFHYVASIALVCITTVYVYRMGRTNSPRKLCVPRGFYLLNHALTLVLALTILVGVATTANGPHSGDANVQRTGFDATLLAHLHAWPGYLLMLLALATLVWAALRKFTATGPLFALNVILVTQISLGIYQANYALPALAVGLHMVLAAISASVATMVLLKAKA